MRVLSACLPVFYCLFLCLPGGLFAQQFGGRVSAFGLGAYSRYFDDAQGSARNPAALAAATRSGQLKVSDPADSTNSAGESGEGGLAAATWGERKYLLPDLQQFGLAARYRTGRSGIGIDLNHHLAGPASESRVGLGYGLDLGRIRIGTRFSMARLAIPAYGSATAWSADVALLWELSPNLVAGIQVENLIGQDFGPEKSESFRPAYRMGFGYEFSDRCYLATELTKEAGMAMNIRLVLQYQYLGKLYTIAGMETSPGAPFIGAGWALSSLRLYITGSYHQRLGFSPGVLIIFDGKKLL